MKTLQSKKASWSERSIFSLIILIVAAQGAAAQTNTFPSSGNVGVGTTSPRQLLQINTSTSGGGVLLSNTASAAGTVTPIGFQFGDGSTAEIWAIKPNAGSGFGPQLNTDLSFRVWDSAVAGHWSHALYIKSNGNVGIGTTTPGSKLDVVGNINTSTQYNIGGNRVFSVTGSNNTFAGLNAGNSITSAAFGNSFFGSRAGNATTSGDGNSFFGDAAGRQNTTGALNSFFGQSAGSLNTTGVSNSFFGSAAGQANTTGRENSFFGNAVGGSTTTGSQNSFFGVSAGFRNTTGLGNSFFGYAAGQSSTTGGSNIVIGNFAGTRLITGSNNIYLANVGADESNRIRIGTQGTHTATFIAGIRGTSVIGDAVFVNANGQLGVGAPSSRRFKQDISAMGNASDKLMQLRPVVFHYRPEYVTGKPMPQYGLIAEEVAKVYPELVGYGVDGKPQTVRYHLLNTLLLNEVQKQKSQIQSQEEQLKSQARQIADMEARLRRLEPQASTRRRRR